MDAAFAARLDNLAAWRMALDRSVAAYAQALAEHELLQAADEVAVASLRERLADDRLVLAVVAEVSRGKSELINAMLFADAGRRMLPATPGRTTMCPVELYHDASEPPQLSLLPLETRLQGLSLADLRRRGEAWQRVPLDPADAEAMALALQAVTRTQPVDVQRARALGLWHDDTPEDNPPLAEDGRVQVPAWRHALINHPHPLLRSGLVVLDTPGLNAIGAEPELTLALLPAAHATLFVLSAGSGVTKSDLALWRDHLGGRPDTAALAGLHPDAAPQSASAGPEGAADAVGNTRSASIEEPLDRFVVLNKIDALIDPLATPAEAQAQIERQRELTASLLGVPVARVFALSARDALAARVAGDEALLQRSRLPELEAALAAELLPRRADLLSQAVLQTFQALGRAVARRLDDRRRQNAEQLLELRSLRGKGAAKQRLMVQRVEAEAAEFERCVVRLGALRAVHRRLARELLVPLSTDTLRTEVAAQRSVQGALSIALGARKSFDTLFTRLRMALVEVRGRAGEMEQMLRASFAQLNADFGFAFVVPPPPALGPYDEELAHVERDYTRYTAWSQAWRLSMPAFAEQFWRLLQSRLNRIFESAAADLTLWSKSAMAQVDLQLRERRRAFAHRREVLERIAAATGELEQRLAEVEAQDEWLQALQRRLAAMAGDTLAMARRPLAPGRARATVAQPSPNEALVDQDAA
jgi:hypothetical protein